MLEIFYEVIEDVGINIDKYDGKIGIICGFNENEYVLKIYYEKSNNNIMNEILKMYFGFFIVLRVVYKLNFIGLCMVIKDICVIVLVVVYISC